MITDLNKWAVADDDYFVGSKGRIGMGTASLGVSLPFGEPHAFSPAVSP
jgi:hypothetical protein